MPFAKQIIKPRRLNRVISDQNQPNFEIFCNNALVSALLQLSNLAEVADNFFSELTDELILVVDRADGIKKRLDTLTDHTSQLNARAIPVPEGDLKTYASLSIHYHYRGDDSYGRNMFTKDDRLKSVRSLHKKADDSPMYAASPTEITSEFKPASVTDSVCKTCDPQAESSQITFHPLSISAFPEIHVRSNDQRVVPPPDKTTRNMSKSHPVVLVPINVTGERFERMCEKRVSSTTSVRPRDGTLSLKRKKRRQTVSGVPGLVFNEISKNLFNMRKTSSVTTQRSMSQERPKSAALESYAPKQESCSERRTMRDREKQRVKKDPDESNLSRSCSLRRSLRSLFKDKRSKSTDLWAEGRPRSPGLPVVDLNCNMKRSSSLPRSLKSVMAATNHVSEFDRDRSASTEGYLDARSSAEPKKNFHKKKEKDSNKSKSRIPRSVSHGANWCDSQLVDNHKPVPQSVSPWETDDHSRQSYDNPTSSNNQSNHHVCKKGQHVHVNIPDKPWTKPFSKVKLRLKKKTKTDAGAERQSSSGHWSISSGTCTRQSLDSDYRCSVSSPERISICEKDSAISFTVTGSERLSGRVAEESFYQDVNKVTVREASCADGSLSGSKHKIGKISTSDWLKHMKFKKSRDTSHPGIVQHMGSDASPEGTSKTASTESWLTTQNLKAHDSAHLAMNKDLQEGGLSVYEFHKNDFYDAMHMDCGLRKHVMELVQEETASNNVEIVPGGRSNKHELSSFVSNYRGNNGTIWENNGDNMSSLSPPPPPPRVNSIPGASNMPFNTSDPLSDSGSVCTQAKALADINPSTFRSVARTNDEDIEMLEYSSAWKPNSSDKSATQTNGAEKLEVPLNMISHSTLAADSSISVKQGMNFGKEPTPDSQFNTWPSLSNHKQDSAAKPEMSSQLKPPTSLTIRPPSLKLLYSDEKFAFLDGRHTLPKARSPENLVAPAALASVVDGKEMPKSETVNSTMTGLNNSRTLDKSDWTSTWPRRKVVTFVSNSQKHSRDDSSITMTSGPSSTAGIIRKSNTFHTKGDSAHYINSSTAFPKAPISLPLGVSVSSPDPHAAHAKLVISSPVGNKACFVENINKRSICSPVTANDMLKFWNYDTPDKWYNTLPRKNKPEKKEIFTFSNGEIPQTRTDNEIEPAINVVPPNVPMMDFASSVIDEDPADSKRPPSKPLYPSIRAMKHSLTFPVANSTPQKSPNPTNYGRTWYDGFDAPSTVVVMNPDGTQTWKGTHKSFTSFLREQNSGSSLGIPAGMPCSRRDSTVSSMSTNSSGSNRRPDTLAQRMSNSRLSRTSFDATSISSQTSSGVLFDIKSNSSVPVDDDDISVARSDDATSAVPYKPVAVLSRLKRSSSCDSLEAKSQALLDTIVGSDTESLQNTDKDQSFASTCTTSSMEPAVMGKVLEPNAKRQKTTPSKSPKSRNHRHRLSNKKNKHTSSTTTSGGPVINVDLSAHSSSDQNIDEIRPMPLISNSFVGTMKSSNKSEPATVSLKPSFLFASKPHEMQFSVAQASVPSTPVSSVLQNRPVDPPPAPPQNRTIDPPPVPAQIGPVGALPLPQQKRPVNLPPAPPQNRPVDPLPPQHRPVNPPPAPPLNKRVDPPPPPPQKRSFDPLPPQDRPTGPPPPPPQKYKSMSSELSVISITKSPTVLAKDDSKSEVGSSFTRPSGVAKKLQVLNSKEKEVPKSCKSSGLSPPQCVSPLPVSTASFPSCSHAAITETSTTVSPPAADKIVTKPTPPKFLLPKLKPWNPSLYDSRSSSLVSKYSATAAPDVPVATVTGTTGGAMSAGKPVISKNVTSNNIPTKSVKDVSEDSGLKRDSSKPLTNVQEVPKTVTDLQKTSSETPSEMEQNVQTSLHPRSSLNQSLVDLSEIQPQLPMNSRRASLNKSTSCLNKWSSTDLGSSSLSLARSVTSLNRLNIHSSNLSQSSLSLATSTDSLASNSSTAERNRSAKIEFLRSNSVEQPKHVDRFSNYSLGKKKLSASRTSLISVTEQPESTVDDSFGIQMSSSKTRSSSIGESRKSSSSSRDSQDLSQTKSSPIQGKFVSSIMGKLQKKGLNTSMTKISQTALDSI